MAPVFEELSRTHPDAVFLEVDADACPDVMRAQGVTSLPRFQLFVKGSKVAEVQGANADQLRREVEAHKQPRFAGQGQSVGSGTAPALSREEARQRRLARLAGNDAPKEGPDTAKKASAGPEESSATPTRDPAAAAAADTVVVDRPIVCEDGVCRIVRDDEDEDGSHPQKVARTEASGGQSFLQRLARGEPMQDDPETEREAETTTPPGGGLGSDGDKEDEQRAGDDAGDDAGDEDDKEPPSVDGELLARLEDMGFSRSMAARALLGIESQTLEGAMEWLEAHQDDATLHEEVEFTVSSKEDMEAKKRRLQELLKQRREERAKRAKEDAKERERQRRQQGKEMAEARENLKKQQRMRAIQERKREEEFQRRERDRIRREVLRTKAERMAAEGKHEKAQELLDQVVHASDLSHAAKPTLAPAEERMDKALKEIDQYRVTGQGTKAMDLLLKIVHNSLEKGAEDDKFNRVNTDSKTYRRNLGSIVGPRLFLSAVGFRLDRTGAYLQLDRNSDGVEENLRTAAEKLHARLDAV